MCECVSYVVRSDHLVTSDNFSACVRCVRHLSEAASSRAALDHDHRLRNNNKPPSYAAAAKSPGSRREKAASPTRLDSSSSRHAASSVASRGGEVGGAKASRGSTYGSVLLQLLDLLDALYSKVGGIFDSASLSSLKSRLAESSGAKTADSSSSSKMGSGRGEGYCPDVDGSDGGGGGGALGRPEVSESVLMWSVTWCPLLQGQYMLQYIAVH